MPTTTCRTTALLASVMSAIALAFAATGPVPAAYAEDNADDEPDQELACATLEDAFERAAQIASDARAAGDMSTYRFYANLAAEIYLDAEFDWQCDWAAAMRPPRRPLIDAAAPEPVGTSAGLTDGANGSIRPPRFAVENRRGYVRWLRSKEHRAACRTLGRWSNSVGAQAAGLAGQGRTDAAGHFSSARYAIDVAAHFGGCRWARETPSPVAIDDPTAPTGVTDEPVTEPAPTGEATVPTDGSLY